MVENKNTNATYENNETTSHNKVEWISKEPIPHFRYGGKEFYMLNDMIEVVIDGILYRVKSIYSDSAFMGDVLDSLTMEKSTELSHKFTESSGIFSKSVV